MIKGIDASEDPGKLLGQAMQIPIFTEFVEECLRIVEPQNEEEMKFVTRRWNAPSSWENLGKCYTTVWYSIKSSEHYLNYFIF